MFKASIYSISNSLYVPNLLPNYFIKGKVLILHLYNHPIPVLLPGKIPWTEESGRLQSMGLLKVGHD